VGCGLVFLVALGTHRGFATAGTPPRLPGLEAAAVGLYSAVVVVAAIGFVVLVYLLVASGVRRRKKDEEHQVEFPIPWLAKAVAWLVVLLLCGGLAALIFLWRGESTSSPTAIVPVSVPTSLGVGGTSPPLESAPGGQPVYWWLIGAVCLAGAAGIAGAVLLLRGDKSPAGDGTAAEGQAYARQVIETSLQEIEAESDARRAVIRAYVSMEHALGRHGLARRPSEAPLEYLGRWLAGLGVSHPAAERLTWLFQRARFSSHPVDKQMKQEAVAALVAIREELLGEHGS